LCTCLFAFLWHVHVRKYDLDKNDYKNYPPTGARIQSSTVRRVYTTVKHHVLEVPTKLAAVDPQVPDFTLISRL